MRKKHRNGMNLRVRDILYSSRMHNLEIPLFTPIREYVVGLNYIDISTKIHTINHNLENFIIQNTYQEPVYGMCLCQKNIEGVIIYKHVKLLNPSKKRNAQHKTLISNRDYFLVYHFITNKNGIIADAITSIYQAPSNWKLTPLSFVDLEIHTVNSSMKFPYLSNNLIKVFSDGDIYEFKRSLKKTSYPYMIRSIP